MEIRRNVLLADANEEFRTMLREEIEKSESFAVVGSTGNGTEVLALANERRPDLLVMDVILPGQDGLSVLRQRSAEVIIAGTAGNNSVTNYRLRNQYMVDHASCLLAVYDNDRNLRSGTMQTVNYARRKCLPITLIHPDSAAVSYENKI